MVRPAVFVEDYLVFVADIEAIDVGNWILSIIGHTIYEL